MRPLIVLILLLACWPVGGAEPSMSGPTEAEPREYIDLAVDGIPDTSLADAKLVYWPETSVSVRRIKEWDGRPFIQFRAVLPADYLVVVVASVPDGKVTKLIEIRHVISVRGPPPVVVDPPPVDPPITPPIIPPVDKATYIYEKDDGAVPAGVAEALQQLNNQGIMATEFEQNTVSGTGEVPAQYTKSLAAAQQAGLPCLVIEAGGEVVRILANPTTLEAVMEATR